MSTAAHSKHCRRTCPEPAESACPFFFVRNLLFGSTSIKFWFMNSYHWKNCKYKKIILIPIIYNNGK